MEDYDDLFGLGDYQDPILGGPPSTPIPFSFDPLLDEQVFQDRSGLTSELHDATDTPSHGDGAVEGGDMGTDAMDVEAVAESSMSPPLSTHPSLFVSSPTSPHSQSEPKAFISPLFMSTVFSGGTTSVHAPR